ncbi:unnamed protein product [Closterium sp. NIES-64]|nr:unnamed protein product [Closterium sp. NIES-64]
MPVALGDGMHYPPQPFVVASAVAAPPVVSAFARAAAEMSPHHVPLPAPPAAQAPATVEAPPPEGKSAPAVPPPEVPNLAAPLGALPPEGLAPAAAPPPPPHAPSPPAPAASAPAPGSRLRLPPVPPVAGVEFVAVGDLCVPTPALWCSEMCPTGGLA